MAVEGVVDGRPRRYQAERRQLAAQRKQVFLDPPARRNRVWQADFTEFETSLGGHSLSLAGRSRFELLPIESLHRPLQACIVPVAKEPRRRRRALLLDPPQGRLVRTVLRRTKVIGRFPGETSCLTLAWAVMDLVIAGGRGLRLTLRERRQIAALVAARSTPQTEEQMA